MMSEAQIREQHIRALLALSQQEKAKPQPDHSLSYSGSGPSRSNLKPPPPSGNNRRLPVKKRTDRQKLQKVSESKKDADDQDSSSEE